MTYQYSWAANVKYQRPNIITSLFRDLNTMIGLKFNFIWLQLRVEVHNIKKNK